MSRHRRGFVLGVVGAAGLGMLVPPQGVALPAGPVGTSAGVGALSLAVGDVEYRMVDLGSDVRPGEYMGECQTAADLNDRGQVTGYLRTGSGERHAFLWDPVAGMTDLGTLGDASSCAFDVNDAGQVAGSAQTGRGDEHAFLWDRVAGMTDLATVDLGWERSQAVHVNEQGQATGYAENRSEEPRAFLWDPVTGLTDLGTLGGYGSYGADLNEAGQVVGHSNTASEYGHAFLWDPVAGMTDLGTLAGGESMALDVNEAGQVMGRAWTSAAGAHTHAFVWDPVGGMTDLGTLGGEESWPARLNERGQVVGAAWTGSGQTHAFLWDPGAGMIDLGTLGGDHSTAADVNNGGQVAGQAQTDSGEQHAFLWDPVAGMTDLGAGTAVAVNEHGQVAGISDDGQAVLWTPAVLAPRVRVAVAKVGYGNKLRVNVDPDRIGSSWRFRVQKRVEGVWRTQPGAYQTRGTAETRRLALGPGRFRVRVLSWYGYTGATSAAVRLTRPTVRVQVGSDAARTRLRIDVDPDKGAGYWTFQVQRRRACGTWRTLPTTYRTSGSTETRVLDLRRGTYRVVVNSKYHFRGTTSDPVRLAR